jgi:2-oxoglutarate dehydrogenase, E1 component
MFNNNLNYMEDLIDGEVELAAVLENKAERFALVKKCGPAVDEHIFKQCCVDSLLWAYRDIGYLYAKLNPLGEKYNREFTRLPEFQEESYHKLSLEEFGLSDADRDTEFFGGKSVGKRPLREILDWFNQTYCSSIGVEFLHIQNKNIREWLIEKMESVKNTPELSREQKRIILDDLIKNEEMENFLHRTFIGQKRFSIQGADVLIPALHFLTDSASRSGIEEIVLGTSHRGRLSVLNFILNLSPEDIFFHFEENFMPEMPGGSGDVKYHIGYCTKHVNDDGTAVNITLLPNSSYLESVDAIVEGDARGVQDLKNDALGNKVIPVLIHGDASFSAQGVVAETFNLSRLPRYTTRGTIHIVINNQIGFTTSSIQGRSGLNPTDVAKMLPVPIFHVNGDNPESVIYVIDLALEYRRTFHSDVVVDIYCFRKYGHNEGDEPSYTQPYMYELIKSHEGAASLFFKKCLTEGIVTADEPEKMRNSYRETLVFSLKHEREKNATVKNLSAVIKEPEWDDTVTAVDETTLIDIIKKITTIPPNFNIHSRLKNIIENNFRKFSENGQIEWGMSEALAYGTLLLEGIPVRLSGQDSERGTFSQRHLVWWELEKMDCCHYIPLANLSKNQAEIMLCASPLSEYSVLAFEYGYATARPDALVIWEAQFGDFVNGGQVIIDNYIIAGRSKWGVENDLVMLLPHGYEGQGPEHSNGHMDRFLHLCAEDNIRVCNVSTPSQYFHLLRKQKKGRKLRPLVIMTPKSLLRHPRSVSSLHDLSKGSFQRILEDQADKGIGRLLFCTGKIYYDLTGASKKDRNKIIGIVRVEQLYPFPRNEIDAVLRKYRSVKSYYWVQEEPQNRGAWGYMREQFDKYFSEIDLKYIGRNASASAATGSLKLHNEEQATVVARALKE